MNDTDLLAAQRRLRRTLFEGSGAVRWLPARDLAARLLLYLDDPRACWQLTVDWLRETLDADRVDGGFGGYVLPTGERQSYMTMAESRRSSLGLHPSLGRSFDAAEPGIRVVWRNAGLTPFDDVAQEREMTPALRHTLLAMGTAAKLALPLVEGGRPVGLLCADWHRARPRWNSEACNQMTLLATQLLGPVLAVSERLARSALAAEGEPGAGLEALTPAERRVARLVAQGLSYKEVAHQLGRSLSTVDHQLRSIRQKLGVESTTRLIRLLNERQPAGRH